MTIRGGGGEGNINKTFSHSYYRWCRLGFEPCSENDPRQTEAANRNCPDDLITTKNVLTVPPLALIRIDRVVRAVSKIGGFRVAMRRSVQGLNPSLYKLEEIVRKFGKINVILEISSKI